MPDNGRHQLEASDYYRKRGDALRQLRLSAGLSTKQAADHAIMTRETVDKMEAGKQQVYNNEFAMRLLEVYQPDQKRRQEVATLLGLLGTPADPIASLEVLTHAEKAQQESDAPRDAPTGASIFISYRRNDEPGFAGRLYDRLSAKFGEKHIFMDVDSIDLGVDFVDVLNESLEACEAVIVIIGKRWLDSLDANGQRRLDNSDDFVRLELEVALQRKIRVIPVLIDGAQMPRSGDLPASLASLARRNGREMSHARFGSDVYDLIATLERILGID